MKNFFSWEEEKPSKNNNFDEVLFVSVIHKRHKKAERYDPLNLFGKKEEKKKDKYDFFGWNGRSK